MATSSGRIDEFVKDYLIYRGLSSTLRTLELELKNEKEKAFRVICIKLFPFSFTKQKMHELQLNSDNHLFGYWFRIYM